MKAMGSFPEIKDKSEDQKANSSDEPGLPMQCKSSDSNKDAEQSEDA